SLLLPPPTRSTLFPYTTLFRSVSLTAYSQKRLMSSPDWRIIKEETDKQDVPEPHHLELEDRHRLIASLSFLPCSNRIHIPLQILHRHNINIKVHISHKVFCLTQQPI